MDIMIIAIMVCSIAHQGLEATNETTFTQVIETKLSNPTTIVVGWSIYTISKTKQSLSVNSTESTCKLAVDPFDENIEGRINALALGDKKQIIVWGIQKSEAKGNIRRTTYTLLIVDPVDCKYIVVPLSEEDIPNNWPRVLPQIVVENMSFMIFYPSQQQCNPCEYWNWGDRVKSISRRFPYHNGVPSRQFFIEPYNGDSYYKVFYAYNFDSGKVLMEILDMLKFEEGIVGKIDGNIDAISVSYGNYQNTAICSLSNDRREVQCARLTAKLQLGASWNLPLKNNLTVNAVSIKVDKVGNTFIGLIDLEGIHLFIYNVDAQLVADLNFGQIDDKYINRDVNGLQFGKQFCLVGVAYLDVNAQDTRHVVKCIEISKYINATW